MQDKFEMFDKLPTELQLETAKNLSNRDLVTLAKTSKYHLALFKPMAAMRRLPQLLQHVVNGEHDKVQSVLTYHIDLIYKRDKVTDCSGREFENISGFEYALWALDKHMWAKMIACIPQNEEGREVFAQLLAQYNKINTVGVTYKLNGETIIESHFDFRNTIINELQTQLDSLNSREVNNEDAIKQWVKGVGGAQKLLPMHAIFECCSNELFRSVPKFIIQPKSSTQFCNRITKKNEDWFSIDSKLGIEFAISKACRRRTGGVAVGTLEGESVAQVLRAMTALCEIRTQDFINLNSHLKEQASLDNHPLSGSDVAELTPCR